MAKPSQDRIVAALLERHGQTYAAELGIRLERGTPSVLFRWLCASVLLSARISADAAMQAARALAEHGWTTGGKLAAATWEQRTRALNQAGYARYDESTSRMLGDTARMLLDKYRGDLRQLRAAAERDPGRERALLKECKGIGEVGADIFCREAQVAWDELFPFADRRALETAGRLGLEDDAARLEAGDPEGLPAPARGAGAHRARQGPRWRARGGESLTACPIGTIRRMLVRSPCRRSRGRPTG